MQKGLYIAVLGILLSVLCAPHSMAAKPSVASKESTPLGIDVSWPQCDRKLPVDHAFGIVGVNDGLANTTNPCLAEQLAWAKKAVGGTPQERVQLYVNTANPGGLGTISWPKSNDGPSGMPAPNDYGICDGGDTFACAWQYGWNRAYEDAEDRLRPAALIGGVNPEPSTYLWWLDVETENTWKSGSTLVGTASNVAVLEGMTAYFESINARVGLYSTSTQWHQIVGDSISDASNLIALPNWRPGGANLNLAKQACRAEPLTSNGRISLTQFVSRGLDYNYSCD